MTTDQRRPRLIGHRGAPLERPENTLPSFLRALELGADGIELDVHGTRDRVVVVHHDPVPRSPAPSAALAAREIATLTWDDLQGFSIGGSALIPTLEEVLAAMRGRADVHVELKGSGIEREVVDVIRRSPAPSRCSIHSFDHEAVRRARRLAPEIRGGVLFDVPVTDARRALREADARDLWPRRDLIEAGLVDEVHGAGGRVLAWTVNDPAEAAALRQLGVDALCTDRLPAIRSALEA